MSTPVPDPLLPSQAIMPDGRIGHKAYLVPSGVDVKNLSEEMLENMPYMGYLVWEVTWNPAGP